MAVSTDVKTFFSITLDLIAYDSSGHRAGELFHTLDEGAVKDPLRLHRRFQIPNMKVR